MLKFLKTMVAVDGTIMGDLLEVLAQVVQAAKEVQLHEEKEVLLQDEKVLVTDSEVIKAQRHAKAVLAEEANHEVHQRQELAVFLIEAQEHPMLQDVMVVLQKDQQDAPKVLAIRLERKDQEEANTIC